MDSGHTILPALCEEDILPASTCNLQLAGALLCDAWHHHYHYQSSAQYLWLAESLMGLGRREEAAAAYSKAVFQDHSNAEALEGRRILQAADMRSAKAPRYDRHPPYDREFRNLTGQSPDAATRPHDEAASALLAGKYNEALARSERSIATSPHHSDSHFLRGKCHFFLNDFGKAYADFTESIRLSHARHDAYHRMASSEHFARGRQWLKQGSEDLAISDFTKALDLYKGNKAARAARAAAYRAKGNLQLAQEDERLM